MGFRYVANSSYAYAALNNKDQPTGHEILDICSKLCYHHGGPFVARSLFGNSKTFILSPT
jgi:hypothetical protein